MRKKRFGKTVGHGTFGVKMEKPANSRFNGQLKPHGTYLLTIPQLGTETYVF